MSAKNKKVDVVFLDAENSSLVSVIQVFTLLSYHVVIKLSYLKVKA